MYDGLMDGLGRSCVPFFCFLFSFFLFIISWRLIYIFDSAIYISASIRHAIFGVADGREKSCLSIYGLLIIYFAIFVLLLLNEKTLCIMYATWLCSSMATGCYRAVPALNFVCSLLLRLTNTLIPLGTCIGARNKGINTQMI
jgi:hypothetical protein